MKPSILAPSILSADFTQLGKEIAEVEAGGADYIHVDVMDGRFVPNITIGPLVVEAVRRSTRGTVDVHLMIVEPERYVDAFIDAGADIVTVHQEACVHLERTLSHIKSRGKKAGVSLNPATSESTLQYVAPLLDLVLVMSVNPGFGGQKFLPSQLQKISAIKAMLRAANNEACVIEVDGGVSVDNAMSIGAAGADAIVAGNAVFRAANRAEALRQLRLALDTGRGGAR